MKGTNIKKIGKSAYRTGIQLMLVGILTGFFAGVVVTFYTILAGIGEESSRTVYELLREHPSFIPLLFVVLFIGAILIGGIIQVIPMIKGSGIPQTEGAIRGVLHYHWIQVLCGMFAASLFTIFMGMSAGSEGPSLQIGGACGYGTATTLNRKEMIRRYQVTGGACAGLAIAFNAPLTGMAFAFEEAHKRFTSEVFVCSFSSVITGIITRNLLRASMGYSTGSVFTNYLFNEIPLSGFGYVAFCAIICAFLGVAFYKLLFIVKNLFSKITFFKGCGKMIIPFFLAGIFGLITVYAMGGGHELIETLGTNGTGILEIEKVFSSPIMVTLLLIALFKFIATIVNMGAGVPCGAFIPMLAIGACIGALLSQICVEMGMDARYCDLITMICMATFFTTIVKAPITGIVMVIELTWSFSSLIPIVLGVGIGYIIGNIFHLSPVYDRLLDCFIEDNKIYENIIRVSHTFTVAAESIADGKALRDILWPSNALVVVLERNGQSIVPDGETVLYAGDCITIRAETSDEKALLSDLKLIVGEKE